MTTMPKLRNRIAIAIAILSTGLAPHAAWAAADDAKLRAIVDRQIRPLMAKYDVPGLAVAVTVDGQEFFFNYGVASKEQNIPVSEATLFELGSVSKTFIATVAAYAQGQGKLSLEDHPSKYMPQLKGSAIDKASLLHLGTYSAGGLPLQFPDEVADDGMIAYFRQWKPAAAPGVQRLYSNPSIGLFGHLAALALQRDYADIVENQIFPALGIKSSYIRVPQSAMANYAWGYDEDNKPIRSDIGVLSQVYGGVKANTADMIRYVQANIDPSRLEAPLRRAVEDTHVGYFKVGPMVQGLGWEQYAYPVSERHLQAGNSSEMSRKPNPVKRIASPQVPSAPTLYNKTGATGGFGAYVAFVPQRKIGIVLLANKNYPIEGRVKAAYAILEQLAPAVK